MAQIPKDIPPFVLVGREPIVFMGLNVVGLRRRGFTSEQINSIQEIYRYIYQTGNNVSQAAEKIEKELPETAERNQILEFIRISSRGIVRGNMEG